MSDVLMHDVLFASGIPVDVGSPQPVAVFRNPARGRAWDRLEALVIGAADPVRKVRHVVRDPEAAHGWSVSEVTFGLDAAPVEIVACVWDSTVWCLMLTDRGKAYRSRLQPDGTWHRAQPLGPGVFASLETSFDGRTRPFVYARTRADAANVVCFTAPTWQARSVEMPNERLVSGTRKSGGAREYLFGAAMVGESNVVDLGVVGPRAEDSHVYRVASQPGKRPRQVVELSCNDDGDQATVLVLNTDGSFSTGTFGSAWATRPLEPAGIPGLPADVTFTRVLSYLSREGTSAKPLLFRDLYAVDNHHRLWVIRRARDGSDAWHTPAPIDDNVGGIAATGGYLGETALFSYAPDGGHLRLDIRDGRTGHWRGVHVLPPNDGRKLYEGAFHRVEALVCDAAGVPLPLHPVTLAAHGASTDCEVFWNDPRHHGPPLMHTIGAAPTALITDAEGRVTLTLRADTLAAPELLLKADDFACRIRPGAKVLAYLNGTGTLRESDPRGPLTHFDRKGVALAAAGFVTPGTGSAALARCAATVGEIAAHGLATSPKPAAPHRAPADIVAYSGLLEGLGHLAGDLWQGVKHGLVQVGKVFKEGKDWVCRELTVLGRELDHDARLVVEGVETATHAIVSVLHRIGAEATKIMHWLTALFHFKDIWETKMAVEEAFRRAGTILGKTITSVKDDADQWLAKQENELAGALDKLKAELTGVTINGTRSGLASSHPGLTQAGSDPQSRWFTGKVHNAGAPDLPALSGGSADLVGMVAGIATRFQEETSRLFELLEPLLRAPGGLAAMDLADLVERLKAFVIALIRLVRTVAVDILTLLESGLGELTSTTSEPLDWGPLAALWAWMAKAAGHEHDTRLSFGGVLALLIAFPATIGYKIVTGRSDARLFPDGRLPGQSEPASPAHVAAAEHATPYVGATPPAAAKYCNGAAGFATIVQAIPLAWLDVLDPQDPNPVTKWLPTGVSFIGLVIAGLTAVGSLPDATGLNALKTDMLLDAGLVAGPVCTALGYLATICATFVPGALWGTIAPLFVTFSGVCALAWVSWAVARKNVSGGLPIAGAFVGTLPPLFGFLSLPALADTEWVRAVHAAIDYLGNGSCGGITMVDALSPKTIA
ncbi:hypothetical protein [Embleya sp. AB8]|uniref:hypothetical protein n=1 Tax=Embleya sp. AB8 TaxID=3156304 RepID=UPI003C74DA96